MHHVALRLNGVQNLAETDSFAAKLHEANVGHYHRNNHVPQGDNVSIRNESLYFVYEVKIDEWNGWRGKMLRRDPNDKYWGYYEKSNCMSVNIKLLIHSLCEYLNVKSLDMWEIYKVFTVLKEPDYTLAFVSIEGEVFLNVIDGNFMNKFDKIVTEFVKKMDEMSAFIDQCKVASTAMKWELLKFENFLVTRVSEEKMMPVFDCKLTEDNIKGNCINSYGVSKQAFDDPTGYLHERSRNHRIAAKRDNNNGNNNGNN